MISTPTVSVVTPMHNSVNTIGDALDSIARQSHGDWEAVVVDDGGTDGSADIVKDYIAADGRFRLLRNARRPGPSGARNTAIEAAHGRYIAFLDSDDLWYPEKLAMQLAFMVKTNAALSFTAYEIFDTKSRRKKRLREAPEAVTYSELLNRNHIGCLTAMYDTTQVGKIYMPDIRMRQDWGLWLLITRFSEKPALGLNDALSIHRVRPGSLSRNKLAALWYNYRLLREFEHLGAVDAATRTLRGGVLAATGQ